MYIKAQYASGSFPLSRAVKVVSHAGSVAGSHVVLSDSSSLLLKMASSLSTPPDVERVRVAVWCGQRHCGCMQLYVHAYGGEDELSSCHVERERDWWLRVRASDSDVP